MGLDITRLGRPRIRGGKLIARCPVCALKGNDRACEHLCCWATDGNGPFHCVCGCDPREIFRLVGKRSSRPLSIPRPPPPFHPPTRKGAPPRLPPLRRLTWQESLEVARLRDWPFSAGVELMTNRGLLWYGDVWDGGREWPAWVVTDSSRRNAQARKFDGSPWSGIGGSKAKSLPGSQSDCLIGACDIGDSPVVILCEGQPDFVASLGCAWFEEMQPRAFAPVCVTGTGNKEISPDMLRHFTGKIVVIPVHNDPNGQGARAAAAWSNRLTLVTKSIHWVEFDRLARQSITRKNGHPVKDLADWCTVLGFDEENDLPIRIFSEIPGVAAAAVEYASTHPSLDSAPRPF